MGPRLIECGWVEFVTVSNFMNAPVFGGFLRGNYGEIPIFVVANA